MDFDTFLITVYSIIDDLYQEHILSSRPNRPGRHPVLSDVEVLTLTILRQWLSHLSEREYTRWAKDYLGRYFPYILSQSAMNRRMRSLTLILCALGPLIEERLRREVRSPTYEVLDSVPVPLMAICRGQKHKLFGDEASIGQGGSDGGWYYGVKLLLAVTSDGVVSGFVVGPARSREHWLTEAILTWRVDKRREVATPEELGTVLGESHKKGKPLLLGPGGPVGPSAGTGEATGSIYLADQGFRGSSWNRHWLEEFRARVLTKDQFLREPVEVRRRISRQFSRLRQVVERAIGGLVDSFGIKESRARSYAGLLARIGAKVAAYNLRVILNHHLGLPTFAHLNPLL